MSRVVIKSLRKDPLFDIDVLEFSASDESFEFTLEFPRGLLTLKEGSEAEMSLGEEEESADILMKGIAYKVDETSKVIEISFHGLLFRMTYNKKPPFELSEGSEVYLSLRFQ
ncbi:MAG: hypothetical protein NZ992_05180 [Candidatus Korarchaeum sp.]|nr:hypothetical protein [Candidatus Korarchaeum sp.]MDW8035732.1 hypothetical protein [Candidatus Korarchaeum sp.]